MENSNQTIVDNKEIVDNLNHLIAIAEDGKEGYKNASTDVKDITMKDIFMKYSNQRNTYIEQLKEIVSNLGGTPERSGGPLGALHRTLMDMKSVFTSGDKDAIINACVTGEEAAVKNYEDVLNNSHYAGNVRMLLEEQLLGIHQAINEIKGKLTGE